MREYVWCSIIGSHMWGMNHPGSDVDVAQIYINGSKKILLGKTNRGGQETKIGKYDICKFEIGHVIEQLKKANLNFIWYVTSPIWKPVSDFGAVLHNRLETLVKKNLSKECFYSIAGLTRNNIRKYFDIYLPFGKKVNPKEYSTYEIDLPIKTIRKKLWLISRTLLFGFNILGLHKIKYQDPRTMFNENIKLQNVLNLYNKFIDAYEISTLPDKPNKDDFDKFLYVLRLTQVQTDHGFIRR